MKRDPIDRWLGNTFAASIMGGATYLGMLVVTHEKGTPAQVLGTICFTIVFYTFIRVIEDMHKGDNE